MPGFAIELTPKQVEYIKMSFNTNSDREVRNILQQCIINVLFWEDPRTKKELEDLNAMKEASRIKG